jgi:aspartyl aminopeptidase
MSEHICEFREYIRKAITPYHSVAAGISLLKQSGFEELVMTAPFSLRAGGKYFVKPYDTMLFAFTVGEGEMGAQAFHIAAAHTDYPCLHLKPTAELAANGYLRLNTEIYGSPILNTWLDRPLSLAGRVALRSENIYEPELRFYDAGRPLVTIPNLAIHMNRKVNEGVELKKQTDLLPLFGLHAGEGQEAEYLLAFLAGELQCKKEDILDFDLYIYNAEEGVRLGANQEFFSAPRLDNQTSCYALLRAIADGGREDGINVIALYDNEEIGSHTKQGADSMLLMLLLEKIYSSLGMDKANLNEAILRSFLFSVDVAHALHPNHPEKYDPVNHPRMNDGVVFKISVNQRYTYDGQAVAIAQQICEKAGAKFKKFVNHADMPGGGTIGPIISSWLPMKTVDIGVPILAMHSARELMGIEDEEAIIRMMTEFFS